MNFFDFGVRFLYFILKNKRLSHYYKTHASQVTKIHRLPVTCFPKIKNERFFLYFCNRIQNTTTMENYQRKQLDVSILTERGNPNMRVMAGKALLDEECMDLKFVENPPRGPRSVEVGRTAHSRYIRRPDGLYTITLRIDASGKYLRETLTSEIAEIAKNIEMDYKLTKKEETDDGSGKKGSKKKVSAATA